MVRKDREQMMRSHFKAEVSTTAIQTQDGKYSARIRNLDEVRVSLERIEIALSVPIAGETEYECFSGGGLFTDSDTFVMWDDQPAVSVHEATSADPVILAFPRQTGSKPLRHS